MWVVIWEYTVRPGSESAFEALHGPQGAWVALFREYPGYLDTELMRNLGTGAYLTVDRWRSEADYHAFQQVAAPRYAEIDALGDALTFDERRIGGYTTTC